MKMISHSPNPSHNRPKIRYERPPRNPSHRNGKPPLSKKNTTTTITEERERRMEEIEYKTITDKYNACVEKVCYEMDSNKLNIDDMKKISCASNLFGI
jgi:Ca2+-binding EF-hand superfamily protein